MGMMYPEPWSPEPIYFPDPIGNEPVIGPSDPGQGVTSPIFEPGEPSIPPTPPVVTPPRTPFRPPIDIPAPKTEPTVTNVGLGDWLWKGILPWDNQPWGPGELLTNPVVMLLLMGAFGGGDANPMTPMLLYMMMDQDKGSSFFSNSNLGVNV